MTQIVYGSLNKTLPTFFHIFFFSQTINFTIIWPKNHPNSGPHNHEPNHNHPIVESLTEYPSYGINFLRTLLNYLMNHL